MTVSGNVTVNMQVGRDANKEGDHKHAVVYLQKHLKIRTSPIRNVE
jgi:hypothetical protein